MAGIEAAKGVPRGPVSLIALVGFALAVSAVSGVTFLWLTMWGPVYFAGFAGVLLFYPVIIIFWLFFEVAAIAAVIVSIIALARSSSKTRSRRYSVIGLVLAGVVAAFSLPALWFGNAPLVMLGVDVLA